MRITIQPSTQFDLISDDGQGKIKFVNISGECQMQFISCISAAIL